MRLRAKSFEIEAMQVPDPHDADAAKVFADWAIGEGVQAVRSSPISFMVEVQVDSECRVLIEPGDFLVKDPEDGEWYAAKEEDVLRRFEMVPAPEAAPELISKVVSIDDIAAKRAGALASLANR